MKTAGIAGGLPLRTEQSRGSGPRYLIRCMSTATQRDSSLQDVVLSSLRPI